MLEYENSEAAGGDVDFVVDKKRIDSGQLIENELALVKYSRSKKLSTSIVEVSNFLFSHYTDGNWASLKLTKYCWMGSFFTRIFKFLDF